MSSSSLNVAIAGGGIGGLALALGLARNGIRPTVYEQAREHSEVGAGISLAPNAVKGLRFLGLEAEVERVADEPLDQLTRHYQTGEPLVTIDRRNTVARYGARYLQMHRADLQDILLRALHDAAGDCIEINHRLTGVRCGNGEISLDFAEQSSRQSDLLIGADGLRSETRQAVFGGAGANYSGTVAWRGLVPTSQLEGISLMPGSSVFVGPERIFVRYPVRRGQVQNFVAFTRETQWHAEGWSEVGELEQLHALFADFHPEVDGILSAYEGKQCHRWGLFERAPLTRWVSGRVALLGDAAHPMLPWFGLGAATAVEDAVVLARALTEFDDIDEALRRYELARYERVTEIHRESLAGGERLLTAYKTLLQAEPLKTEDTLGMTLYDPGAVEL